MKLIRYYIEYNDKDTKIKFQNTGFDTLSDCNTYLTNFWTYNDFNIENITIISYLFGIEYKRYNYVLDYPNYYIINKLQSKNFWEVLKELYHKL